MRNSAGKQKESEETRQLEVPPSLKKANPGWKPTTYVVFFNVNKKLSQEKNQS